jgi:hypothetical protein
MASHGSRSLLIGVVVLGFLGASNLLFLFGRPHSQVQLEAAGSE